MVMVAVYPIWGRLLGMSDMGYGITIDTLVTLTALAVIWVMVLTGMLPEF